MKIISIGILLGVICFLFIKSKLDTPIHAQVSKTIYDTQIKDIDGQAMDWTQFKGKVLLIVNVASRCGFTGQYEGLQELYETYKDKGLVVIGVPSNDFGFQEPGSASEIKSFCQTNYQVSFPITQKVSVRGKNQDPLYQFLTHASHFNSKKPVLPSWNFNKYLVDQHGKVVSHFGSRAVPKTIAPKIEALLDES